MPRSAAALLLLLAGCSKSDPPPKTPTARAVAWLMEQQDKDGRWRSGTYSLLGSGQVMTPFVLYALSHASEKEFAPHREGLDRALDLLPLESDAYPNYSRALSLLALKRFRPDTDEKSPEITLRALQLTEYNQWDPEDPEYGGWDHGGLRPRKPECQRPDLSVTALACEALGSNDPARRFAERCRAKGGGFFFTPSARWDHQNKAGPGIGYASASYDAHRILGTKPDDREKWGALPAEWEEALFFYTAYAESKVLPSKELFERVAARQRPDGSFANPRALMKEDDPLVATGLALVALCLCQ